MSFAIGYDVGSSSVKAALIDVGSGQTINLVKSPEKEMIIDAPQPGWAEQHPDLWWTHLCQATHSLLKSTRIDPAEIKSIGIAYQMHGLVVVDRDGAVLRPSIIWCDSRAVEIGNELAKHAGQKFCFSRLLNLPGNFTASKLAWVKKYEPEIYEKARYLMLPGDYLGYRLTGEFSTTPQGLSEGILWDFHHDTKADFLIEAMNGSVQLIPPIKSALSEHGQVSARAAKETGLPQGIPLTYKSGDQPNNAMSLNVLHPGIAAATGGTSGVVYAVSDQLISDEESKVNAFAHVNHQKNEPRIGILLCVNGTGSHFRFMRDLLDDAQVSYPNIEEMAEKIQIGSEGLKIYPFGNGAERILHNLDDGASIDGIRFNTHTKSHFYRASLEGIAHAFFYGIESLREMGVSLSAIRAGNDNLFQSKVFSQTLSNLLNGTIQLVNTTGAAGAAKASGVVVGSFNSLDEAMDDVQIVNFFEPDGYREQNLQNYFSWKNNNRFQSQ